MCNRRILSSCILTLLCVVLWGNPPAAAEVPLGTEVVDALQGEAKVRVMIVFALPGAQGKAVLNGDEPAATLNQIAVVGQAILQALQSLIGGDRFDHQHVPAMLTPRGIPANAAGHRRA